MALTILLLFAAAIAAWLLARPPKKPPANETPLVQCPHCGVYHPENISCKCKK